MCKKKVAHFKYVNECKQQNCGDKISVIIEHFEILFIVSQVWMGKKANDKERKILNSTGALLI